MNAGPQSIVSLLTTANQRMVIPVYQRPYSWDEEQCQQLWDDIVAIGRRGTGMHFTGSVVMVLDGEFSISGMSRLLVIDGQQRITTLTLLLVALAEYARDNPDEVTHFSFAEIMGSGYLVSPYKKGEDHYRITLSQGDDATLCSIIDHLENPDVDVRPDAHRIIENLDFFRARMRGIDNVDVVWDGIGRLQVVSISLAQGQDNPQLIFESMNSTGKDLSTADLVRNFVLMGLPVAEQNDLYVNYWRKIEETLGADSYDRIFDEFLRDWLTVVYAPTTIVRRDVYRLFKRHVYDNGYDRPGQMAGLLKEIRRFAGYYACITSGASEDGEVRAALARIAALDVSVVNPLIMAVLEDYANGERAFSREDLLGMLRVTESYLFRRSVCDVPTNSLNKFFSSMIARLRESREEGGDYREAFVAILLGEGGTARRMPDDAEFTSALTTRNCYAFRRGSYLLKTLENSYHPKSPIGFTDGSYTIEHIMPRNALAHDEWRSMLGPDCESVHAELLNTLGNLTLTAYNSELSDGSFEEKQARVVGGFSVETLAISRELYDSDAWNGDLIRARTKRLVGRALEVWPMPSLSAETVEKYRPVKRTGRAERHPMTFRMLCAAGGLSSGETLSALESGMRVSAKVTEDCTILLESGEEFESPSRAATRQRELVTGKTQSINGWKYWHVGEDGQTLADVRTRVLARMGDQVSWSDYLATFWDGFFDYCDERRDFVDVYGAQSGRVEQRRWNVNFGTGIAGCSTDAWLARRDGKAGAEIYFRDFELYERLVGHRDEVEGMFAGLDGKVIWNEGNEKSRQLQVLLDTTAEPEEWDKLYRWYVDALLRLRTVLHLAEE